MLAPTLDAYLEAWDEPLGHLTLRTKRPVEPRFEELVEQATPVRYQDIIILSVSSCCWTALADGDILMLEPGEYATNESLSEQRREGNIPDKVSRQYKRVLSALSVCSARGRIGQQAISRAGLLVLVDPPEHRMIEHCWQERMHKNRNSFHGVSTTKLKVLREELRSLLSRRPPIVRCRSEKLALLESWAFSASPPTKASDDRSPRDSLATITEQQERLHLGVMPAGLVSSCGTDLQDALRDRNELEAHLLLRALGIVAVSLRLLNFTELYDAVTTDTQDYDLRGSREDQQSRSQGPINFMRLCSAVLLTHRTGEVDFVNCSMRNFVLGSKLLDVTICHEVMTSICFAHIRETYKMHTSSDSEYRTAEARCRPFAKYARTFWHQHYRLVESMDSELPERLRQLIETAIAAQLPSEDYLSIEVQAITLGMTLNISLLHSFPVLEQLCREAGAQEADVDLSAFDQVSEVEQQALYQQLEGLLNDLDSFLANGRSLTRRPRDFKL